MDREEVVAEHGRSLDQREGDGRNEERQPRGNRRFAGDMLPRVGARGDLALLTHAGAELVSLLETKVRRMMASAQVQFAEVSRLFLQEAPFSTPTKTACNATPRRRIGPSACGWPNPGSPYYLVPQPPLNFLSELSRVAISRLFGRVHKIRQRCAPQPKRGAGGD